MPADPADPYDHVFQALSRGTHGPGWRDFLAALVDVDLLRRDNYDALVLMEPSAQPWSLKDFQTTLQQHLGVDVLSKDAVAILRAIHDKTDLLQERVADNDLSDDSKRHVRRLVHTIVTSAETTRDQLVLLRQRLLDSLRREEDAMWLSHDPENNSDNATSCAWAFQADHTRFIHGDERTWSALQELSVENGLSSVLTFLLPPSFQLLVRGDNQDSSELMTLGTAQLSSAHDNEDALLCLVLECVPTAWSIETTRLVHNFVHAQRELSLSLYFLRFVGAADDGTKTQYAFELPSVQRLSDALCLDTKGRLSPTSASFRSHARELLLALLDLHEQSTHQLLTRLSLDNVVVSVSGRRLLLTQLEFGNAIDPFEADISATKAHREHALVQDLAVLLFSLVSFVTLSSCTREDFLRDYLGVQIGHQRQLSYHLTSLIESTDCRALHVAQSDRIELSLDLPCLSEGFWMLTKLTDKNATPGRPPVIVALEASTTATQNIFVFQADKIVTSACDLVFTLIHEDGVESVTITLVVHEDTLTLAATQRQLTLFLRACVAQPCRVSLRTLLNGHSIFIDDDPAEAPH